MRATFSFEEAIDAIAVSTNLDELFLALNSFRELYGLANIVYHALHIPDCTYENPILILSYDPAWVKRYKREITFKLIL